MKNQDKNLENLLFEVYEKGVKNIDCNLTDYIEKVKQVFEISDVSTVLCGTFDPDNRTSSATKCKCGREKWEHPKIK